MSSTNKSRTYNSILNSLAGIISTILTVLLNFLVRIVIIRELGDEINGIHNLFQNITNVIALMEAGFSTAMIIHLYKPIKEANHHETTAIMTFYKKIYITIAFMFAAVCILINIFAIQYIVKSSIPIWQIRIYFGIYTLITPLSYLTYYKISILYAEQKNRVKAIVTTICEIVFKMLQIVSVIISQQYYVFLVLMIMEKLTINIICSKYVERRHKYLKRKSSAQISVETKNSVYNTVKPIFVNNTASSVQNSAKSILISILLGNVSIVGYFGNYQLVISSAQLLFSQFGAALTSSFGNLAVESDKERMYQVYRKTTFILNTIAIVLCAGFISCIQTFILLFFGENFLLIIDSVIILTAGMLVQLFNVPILSIQNALGLHNKDQIVMVSQAFISIVLGYILGLKYGMNGIFLGLLLPQFIFTLINKGIVINKAAFNNSAKNFLKMLCYELFKGITVIIVSYFMSSFVNTSSLIIDLLLKAIISIIVSFFLLVLLSFKSQYFIDTVNIVKHILRRKPI